MPGYPIVRAIFIGGLLLSSGCSLSEPPQFRLNTEGRDPDQIGLAEREEIAGQLRQLFGTPDEPDFPRQIGLNLARLQASAGPPRSDADGKQWGLYRQHCATCHGISGDGAGPTAAMLNPYPRDFRSGVYKYTSTAGGAKPVREDLRRVLRHGMRGTSMPAFNTLPDEEIEALIEYVKYLSIRGQTELQLLAWMVDEDVVSLATDEVIDEAVWAAASWLDAAGMVVEPPQPPPIESPEALSASIERGKELYRSENARCFTCHGPDGEGDGEQAELYDDWNKPKKGATPAKTAELAPRFCLPIRPLRPRDFTQGIFRGGSRPIDVYWRIHVGIKGTPMPAHGPAHGNRGVLEEKAIWDVVNYVLSRAG